MEGPEDALRDLGEDRGRDDAAYVAALPRIIDHDGDDHPGARRGGDADEVGNVAVDVVAADADAALPADLKDCPRIDLSDAAAYLDSFSR